MSKRTRTMERPYLNLDGHQWRGFEWDVVLAVGSSGYVKRVTVNAIHHCNGTESYGTAWVEIQLGDDVQLAVEACTVEAAAIATEPSLWAAEPTVTRLDRLEVYGR